MAADLARLTIDLIRELSQARRERDLAIELLVVANRHIGYLESDRSKQRAFDEAMDLITADYERRHEHKVAA